MHKNYLFHFQRCIALGLLSIMPHIFMLPTIAQAQPSYGANERLTSEIFQYLAAEIALQRGDVPLAYQTMLNLAKTTRNPKLAQQAMEIALAVKSADASLEAARLWDELTPASDASAKEVYLTLLMFNNKWNEAVEPTIQFLKTLTLAKREEFLVQLLPILNKSNNHDISNIAFAKIINSLSPLPKNTDVLLIYALGEEKLGNFSNMENVLKSIIEQKPNDASALNALGYSFADRNIFLDEALRLIQKAIAISPNDPYIIDSLGWVYYRLGKNDLALQYLTQSFKQLPEAEVGAHLGEVLWVMGQTEEAEKVWRQAETINASHATLRETIKRLRPDWSSREIFDETIARQWEGRFAVNVNMAKKNSGSGAFSLNHQNLNENLEIRSPLGLAIAKINVTPSRATLEQDGKVTSAIDADQLILQATQLPLPARGLSAWLSGFARPGSPGAVKRNASGQVVEIAQDGWLLKYTWDVNNKLQRLLMTRSDQEGNVEVRLVLD